MFSNEIIDVVFVVIQNGEIYSEEYLNEYEELEFENIMMNVEDNYEYCQNR